MNGLSISVAADVFGNPLAGWSGLLGNPWAVLLAIAAVSLPTMILGGTPRDRAQAARLFDSEGRPRGFSLTLRDETITLEPGRPWLRADTYKWSTRGLIEEPQSFHVLADGTVEINGEKIGPNTEDAVERLEQEINKHHDRVAAAKPAQSVSAPPAEVAGHPPDRVWYKVRVDHLGHLWVECHAGREKTETGLRGLPALVQNGFLLPLKSWHVDPLQRSMEIDGVQLACDEAGARQLEERLNAQYAPAVSQTSESLIEVRENPASSTGFDIHFVAYHAGARLEIKGHLSQDKLDILQDHNRCELLRPGCILKISPPFLLIRRRRPDGGEDRIPELPDVPYRKARAMDLQAVLNHPALRLGAPLASSAPVLAPVPPAPAAQPPETVVAPVPSAPPPAALPPPPKPEPRAAEVRPPVAPAAPSAEEGPIQPPRPESPPSATARFWVTVQGLEPVAVIRETFAALQSSLQLPVLDLRLSLPHIFENRRFQVLSFTPVEITHVAALRAEDFFGFYLSHLDEQHPVLVYAWAGHHVEWGPHKCVLQASLHVEAEEHPGPGLLGLAQDAEERFVFVVTPAYKAWVLSREPEFRKASARFLTPEEAMSAPASLTWIWPAAAEPDA